jgi:hypothetical protein
MNEIRSGLLKSGYIQLPVVTPKTKTWTVDKSAVVAALADKVDVIGWDCYTIDGSVVAFAEELPEGATLLGKISIVDNGESEDDPRITVFAKDYATNDGITSQRMDEEIFSIMEYSNNGGDEVYRSAIGWYDADFNQLSNDPTAEAPAGAAFSIKRSDQDTNVLKPESDADFQTDFGTATSWQRTMAMHKLGGFPAADKCFEYQPAADVINMRGMWHQSSMRELMEVATAPKREKLYVASPQWGAVKYYVWDGNSAYTWSCLEYNVGNAWYCSFNGGDTDSTNRCYSYLVRASIVL